MTDSRTQLHPVTRRVIEAALRLIYPVPWPAVLGGLWSGNTEVRRTVHELPLLPGKADRPALRLGFLSDLHFGPTTPPRTLETAFAEMRRCRPDVLVFGGDFVFLDTRPRNLDRLRQAVESLEVAQKFAVLGNHDLWARHERISETLERSGVRVLVNETVRLEAPHEDVALIGVDDPLAGTPDVAAALAGADGAATRLAVCHSPESVPMFSTSGIDLLLCGHTHGGQIAVPRHRPLAYRGKWGRRYVAGLYDVDGYKLFVSRGVGTVVIPLRLFSPPEVVELTLVPADGSPR
jgi:predicted MPP superfamily phosphohydrolase